MMKYFGDALGTWQVYWGEGYTAWLFGISLLRNAEFFCHFALSEPFLFAQLFEIVHISPSFVNVRL